MAPEEFVLAAERLLDDPRAPEADLRAAAHLAYYAVYHFVCRHYGLNPNDRSEARHDQIAARVKADTSSRSAGIRKARRCYSTLYRFRCLADYELGKPFAAADAEFAVENAKAVLGI